jgi:hypothetical protein
MFQIGQHVVCINNVPEGGQEDRDFWAYTGQWVLARGAVYTIRAIDERMTAKFPDPTVRLEEIHCKSYDIPGLGLVEAGFGSRRFRLLDEKRLDVFRAELAKTEIWNLEV